MEEKRKKFNANSWKDGIGGGPGPVRSMPPPSYNKPPPTSQKFPSKMPPGFDGPPGTEEDSSLMPPPMGAPAAPPRGPPTPLMSMDLLRPQGFPEEGDDDDEDEEEQGCMIGPPAPSEAFMGPPPSSSQNWGVPAAGHGSHQGSVPSQAPRPSPLPKDPSETKSGLSQSDRVALHKRMQV